MEVQEALKKESKLVKDLTSQLKELELSHNKLKDMNENLGVKY